MSYSSADLILTAHFLWAVWMISGVGLALVGFRWPRFWRWRVFRITHLIGLLATATVPIWAAGICPLTTWEWGLRSVGSRHGAMASPESFLARTLENLLYVNVDPSVISLVTAMGALVTVVIFILHPPRRALSRPGGGPSR